MPLYLDVGGYGNTWPEALPLKKIRTSDVVSRLFTVFSRLGVPKQILSDNGKQLISEVMREVMKMLGIERRTCTPYHAKANGMVERLNGSLKTMLKKLTRDKPNTWDKLLPAVLFAYREIPNTSTRYPPFTLMYGRQVRGPADILADICAGKETRWKNSRSFMNTAIS
ncbi:Pol polyprotein [Elysia marginata]|uniref:Pol polyprotein n=1 Tax=Elysia marginata TaxID=1093978 RepID=A0AAV4JGA2_9GAST|nr:Pol polyprotein [Elysia marginata]